MPQLIKIGNSQGLRIPKPIIEQAHLAGKELELKVVDNGLLITPSKQARKGWQQKIENTLKAQGAEMLDSEWLDAELVSDDDLEW